MAFKLNYLYLVASFAIGLVIMMITVPRPRVVIKFPTPETADEHVYHGSSRSCYKIAADEEDCPVDGKHVRSQPVSDIVDGTEDGWGLGDMFVR
jgi:hypothetical protein